MEDMIEKEKSDLYYEYKSTVRKWLLKMKMKSEIIDEMINDIFLIFYEKYNSDKYTILSFLFFVTQSIVNKRRVKKKVLGMGDYPVDYDVIDDFEDNIEYEKMWASRISDLHSEIKKLPIKLTDISISYFINNEKMKDIAKFQNMNISTVKSRIQKAKLLLRKKDVYCGVNYVCGDDIVEKSKISLKNNKFIFRGIDVKKIKKRYKYIETVKINRSVKSKFFLGIRNNRNIMMTKSYLFEHYGKKEFKFTIYMGDVIKKYGHDFELRLYKKRLQLLVDGKFSYYWFKSDLRRKSGLENEELEYSLENNKLRVRFRYNGKKDYGTIIEILK